MEKTENAISMAVSAMKEMLDKAGCRQVEFKIGAADETKYLVTEVITGGIRARCLNSGKDGITITITDAMRIFVTHLPETQGEG